MTKLVWLLVSLAVDWHGTAPVQVVERFADVQECSRVATIINNNRDGTNGPMVMCIQANIRTN